MPLFPARVVETEDIDSFLDEKKETTQSTDEKKEKTTYRKKTVEKVPHKIFSLGIGLNFGVFISEDMDDVNEHIYEKVNDDEWTSISQSDANMYLNLVPRFTINIMPIRYLMIQVLGEVGWGPKIVSELLGETFTFHFMRYSPGLILNAYLPLGETAKYSLFVGGGGFYHFFSFEQFEAEGFGGRAQLGLRIDWKTLALEIFAAYDYARGKTGQYDDWIGKDMVLDYSSILFGINLYFKII